MSTRQEAIKRIVREQHAKHCACAPGEDDPTMCDYGAGPAARQAIEAALADDALIAALCAEARDAERERLEQVLRRVDVALVQEENEFGPSEAIDEAKRLINAALSGQAKERG